MTDKKSANKSSKPNKREHDLQLKIDELTEDLKRTRADFENYRKRVEIEKRQSREAGKTSAVAQLLPVIDNIERATIHPPHDLHDNKWVEGVMLLPKQLEKQLEKLGVKRIEADTGHDFDPDFHDAVQFDEESEGDTEVVQAELQAGYTIDGVVVRPAMVRVTRK